MTATNYDIGGIESAAYIREVGRSLAEEQHIDDVAAFVISCERDIDKFTNPSVLDAIYEATALMVDNERDMRTYWESDWERLKMLRVSMRKLSEKAKARASELRTVRPAPAHVHLALRTKLHMAGLNTLAKNYSFAKLPHHLCLEAMSEIDALTAKRKERDHYGD